jgi:Phosphotransferase enzyme family
VPAPDLDARRSPELAARLPGLSRAFDPDVMKELLQSSLLTAHGHVIERCVPGKAHLDGDECVLRYNLELADPSTGRRLAAVVTGKLFADADAGMSYFRDRVQPLTGLVEARPEVAVFDSPAAILGPLRLVVHAFPIDPDLPALVEVTDPARMSEVLEVVLGHSIDDRCRVEVAHYPRRGRCVLRYRLGSGHAPEASEVVYGKVSSGVHRSDGAVIDDLRQRLARDPTSRITIPRYLGDVAELGLILIQGIPGTPQVGSLLKARAASTDGRRGSPTLEEAIDTCAEVATLVHRSGLSVGRARALDEDIAALRRELAGPQRWSPALAEILERSISEIASRARDTAEVASVPSHGDFTPSQILFDARARGLIDFDNLCDAELALDLGQFCAYLRAAALKAEGARAGQGVLAETLRARFMERYVAEAGLSRVARELGARVEVYERVGLLRMAIRSWHQLKPQRVAIALALLDERWRHPGRVARARATGGSAR